MKFIKIKKILIKKIIIITLIIVIQLVGLGLFYRSQNFIYNFKMVYINKIYLPIIKYKLSSIKNSVKAADQETIDNLQIAKSIPVLLYHGVINESDGYNISINNFREQMFALKYAGYQAITLDEFENFMNGKIKLPKKSLLITFDDARKDSYYPVNPFLKALNYNAVMFVITKYSLASDMSRETFFLNKNELKRLADSNNWSLESHSHDAHDMYQINDRADQGHYLTNRLWLNDQQRNETKQEFRLRVRNDLIKSKRMIEKEFGKKVIGYAYPFGELGQDSNDNYNESEKVVIEETSKVYPFSFHQVWTDPRKRTYPSKDKFLVRRIDVLAKWNGQDLINILNQTEDKQLPYSDDFSKNNGWFASWGKLKVANNLLTLSSTIDDDGSLAILEGSFLWKNVDINAEINVIKGDSFSLIGAYQDNNFIACNFYTNGISITKFDKNKDKEISILENNLTVIPLSPGKNIKVGMKITDNKISCQLAGNDILIVNYDSDGMASDGGVGFKTWDNNGQGSIVQVNNFLVKSLK